MATIQVTFSQSKQLKRPAPDVSSTFQQFDLDKYHRTEILERHLK